MKREKFEHWSFIELSKLINNFCIKEKLGKVDFCLIKFNDNTLMYEADVNFNNQ